MVLFRTIRWFVAVLLVTLAALPASAQQQQPHETKSEKPAETGPAHNLDPARAAKPPVLLKESTRDFSRPHDVALHPEGLYLLVADIGNDEIKILNPGTLEIMASFGADIMSSPHDVAFGSHQLIYVADTGNNRILVYRFRGVLRGGVPNVELLAEWTDGVDWPEGVDYGPDDKVYVANVGTNSVAILKDGKLLKKAGRGGDGPLEFARPHDIEVDDRGRVIVADSGNHRIQILDLDLNHQVTLAGDPYHFYEPKYVSVDRNGWLFVADEYNSQIKILDRDNNPVGFIGTGEKGDGPGQLNWPEGITVAGRYIWVSDTYNNRILLFKRDVPAE